MYRLTALSNRFQSVFVKIWEEFNINIEKQTQSGYHDVKVFATRKGNVSPLIIFPRGLEVKWLEEVELSWIEQPEDLMYDNRTLRWAIRKFLRSQ